jgi:hypothetical protein
MKRRAIDGLIWTIAVALCVLVGTRLTLPLALDLESLVWNLQLDWTTDYDQAWYADAAVLEYLVPLLHWGGLPLLAVALAGGGFRLAGLRDPKLDAIARAAPGARLLLGLAALLPFVGFAVPCALALSVWVEVEVYPWLEWHGQVDPVMGVIHGIGPWLMLPGLLLAGPLLLRATLSRPPGEAPPGHSAGRRWSRRLAGIAATLVLLPFALGALAGCLHATRVARLPGVQVHADACDSCHERALPLYYVKTPSEWQRTVATHVEIERVPLDRDEAEALLGFLGSMRSFSDPWTFRTRCGRCHGSTWRSWDRRTKQDWEAMAARLAWWSPYFFRHDAREQVTDFLVDRLGRDDGGLLDLPAERADPVREVYDRCALCHSASYEADRYRESSEAEVLAMVERMNQKLPDPVAADELPELSRRYSELIADPARFDRLFPHDRPILRASDRREGDRENESRAHGPLYGGAGGSGR